MDNPLLSRCFEVPFDRIRAEHVEPAVDQLLQDAQARIDAIVAVSGPRSYTNTLGALEQATEPLDFAMSVVGHLESVATYPELRAAYNAVQPRVSAFYSAIPMNEGLWQALRSFADTAEAGTLPPAHARFQPLLDRSHDVVDQRNAQRLRAIAAAVRQLDPVFEQVLQGLNLTELVNRCQRCEPALPVQRIESLSASLHWREVRGVYLRAFYVLHQIGNGRRRLVVAHALVTRKALRSQLEDSNREGAALLAGAALVGGTPKPEAHPPLTPVTTGDPLPPKAVDGPLQPISLDAKCPAGSSDPGLAFGNDETQAWICTRLYNVDNSMLTITFSKPVVVSSIFVMPGFKYVEPNGIDHWNEQRLVTQIKWKIGGTEIIQNIAPTRAGATLKVPELATQVITMTVMKTEEPPTATGSGSGPLPGIFGGPDTQKIDSSWAISRITITGHDAGGTA